LRQVVLYSWEWATIWSNFTLIVDFDFSKVADLSIPEGEESDSEYENVRVEDMLDHSCVKSGSKENQSIL
jgi:hypothetical protein